MNSLTIRRLSENPLLAYAIQIPEPQRIELTEYEMTAFPALFGQLTGMSVAKIIPKYRVETFCLLILLRGTPKTL